MSTDTNAVEREAFEKWWKWAQSKNALFGTDREVGWFIWKAAIATAQHPLQQETLIELLQRLRPGIEAAPWVIEALRKIAALQALSASREGAGE
jgi:hypothetical protein